MGHQLVCVMVSNALILLCFSLLCRSIWTGILERLIYTIVMFIKMAVILSR